MRKQSQHQTQNDQVFFIEGDSISKRISSHQNNNKGDQGAQNVPQSKKLGDLSIEFDQQYLSETFLNFQTQYYQIYVAQEESSSSQKKGKYSVQAQKNKPKRQWSIERRYSDFQWLYQTLCMTFPGSILPYFPTKDIQSFFLQKLNVKWNINRSKKQQTENRKKYLQTFLRQISKKQEYKNSREFIIFVEGDQQKFRRLKRQYETQLQEVNSYESKNKSVFSIFERSMAWVTQFKEQTQNIQIQEIPEWSQTQLSIKKQSALITSILFKIQRLIHIKFQQVEWQGPQTEIDSVQILKTKVHSARQYNELLIMDLKNQVLPVLQQEAKIIKQIQSQLQQRNNLIKIVIYLRKTGANQNRIKKLLRKKQSFQENLSNQWAVEVQRIKMTLKSGNIAMSETWKNYSQKMNKIWK